MGIDSFYPQINGLITTMMNLIYELQRLGQDPFIITGRVDSHYGDCEVIENIPIY